MPYKNVTFSGYWVPGTTVPNTGGDSMVLIPAVLLLSGIALMAVMLGRKTKKSEK
jgi:LPXTG-motif cell wall-anchored protein